MKKNKTEKAEVKLPAGMGISMETLLDYSPDYILICGRDAKPIYFNKAYAKVLKKLLGIRMRKGLQPHKLLPDKKLVAWWDGIHRRALAGEKFNIEYQHQFENGEIRYFEFSYGPIVMDGREGGFIEISRDITHTRHVEEELRIINKITENMIEGVLFCRDRDLKIIHANKNMEEMFGYLPGELNGKPVSILNALDGNSKDVQNEKIRAFLRKRGSWRGEIENIKKDGTIFWTEASISGFEHFEQGKVWISVQYDISEQKNNQAKLDKIREELELRVLERTNELNRKNIALTELMGQLEVEKKNISERININVQKLLLPIIKKLKKRVNSIEGKYVEIIEQNLLDLSSSYGTNISDLRYKLTPKEIEICDLIKHGFTTKELADLLNLSERTVEVHRFNVRKKLGITSQKVNLTSYLRNL